MPNPQSVLCFSHLRWGFVYQRPNHLMARYAKEQTVYFIEEPIWDATVPWLDVQTVPPGIRVAVPHLPLSLDRASAIDAQRALIDELMSTHNIQEFVAWYYTPMALQFTRHLEPVATVYDCMDELTGFVGCPPELASLEVELFSRADVVFTGGQSLYESKRSRHHNIHAFPSSVDRDHFAQARADLREPSDQASIPGPRLGFFGVIDERMDIVLLDGVARLRPNWQFVLIGPVVKINPAILPQHPNIHYLGQKTYQELPAYIAGWDVALIPFALNDATRFVSPTKTLEYLAAGKPVISTAIRDVVRPYGELGLVEIAQAPSAFVEAAERSLQRDRREWLSNVDRFLQRTSWDGIWSGMHALIHDAIERQQTMESWHFDRESDRTGRTHVSVPLSTGRSSSEGLTA
jgi:glycosyltransferase involved in cell wall biosynthesis